MFASSEGLAESNCSPPSGLYGTAAAWQKIHIWHAMLNNKERITFICKSWETTLSVLWFTFADALMVWKIKVLFIYLQDLRSGTVDRSQGPVLYLRMSHLEVCWMDMLNKGLSSFTFHYSHLYYYVKANRFSREIILKYWEMLFSEE